MKPLHYQWLWKLLFSVCFMLGFHALYGKSGGGGAPQKKSVLGTFSKEKIQNLLWSFYTINDCENYCFLFYVKFSCRIWGVWECGAEPPRKKFAFLGTFSKENIQNLLWSFYTINDCENHCFLFYVAFSCSIWGSGWRSPPRKIIAFLGTFSKEKIPNLLWSLYTINNCENYCFLFLFGIFIQCIVGVWRA